MKRGEIEEEGIEEEGIDQGEREIERNSTIEHIILCGGGPVGLVQYGALKYLHRKSAWNLKNIKSIYACSVGCIIAVIISLDMEWEWIDDFFIKRPWKKLVDLDKINYLDILTHKGLLDEKFWIDFVKPLLLAKDIDIEIDLKGFYELTGIDMHFFTTQVNSLEKCDFNHTTHPELRLTSVIYMSSCIPFLFKPGFIGDNCYLDGGICNNAPIKDCIDDYKCSEDRVLAFINSSSHVCDDLPGLSLKNNDVSNNESDDDDSINNENNENNVNELKDGNVFTFLLFVIRKLFEKLHELNSINNISIKNTINVKLIKKSVDIKMWFEILYNRDYIAKAIEYGESKGEYFYNNIYSTDAYVE